jgi:hypothetical protein
MFSDIYCLNRRWMRLIEDNANLFVLKVTWTLLQLFICLRPSLGFSLGVGRQFVGSLSRLIQSETVLQYMLSSNTTRTPPPPPVTFC